MVPVDCADLQLHPTMSEPAWKPTSHDSRSARLHRQHQHRQRRTQVFRRRLVASSIVLVLIVVGVALDTIAQMNQHLLLRKYDGFMKKGRVRFRGRQGSAGF